MEKRPRIVIIGAGFGGLYAAKTFEGNPVDVLLVDRHNYHTFTPLLYQVATSGLEPESIGYPLRGIFRAKSNVAFLMGEVTEINTQEQIVEIATTESVRREHYDYLMIAAGSVTNYFNNPNIENHAYDLKSLNDAIELRNHILKLFETAAWTDDAATREALTTMVIVGGGPTGLETAGALMELFKNVLSKEYPFLKDITPRVMLIEATDKLLAPFPDRLQKAALRQLKSLGIEVVFGNPVVNTADDHIELKDGTTIPTHTLIWSAGVKANPMSDLLGVSLGRSGRIPVKPTLESVELNNVYIVGDMAYLEDPKGQPYPMLIPVAKQQGILAARNILLHLDGRAQHLFRYVDRGIMATIGRSRAVAWLFNRIQLTGYAAWFSWLGLHLITLMGFRNRLSVFLSWVWNYFTYDRSMRMIVETSAPVEVLEDETPPVS